MAAWTHDTLSIFTFYTKNNFHGTFLIHLVYLCVESDEGGSVAGEGDLVVAIVPPVVDACVLATCRVTPRRHVGNHGPPVLAHLLQTYMRSISWCWECVNISTCMTLEHRKWYFFFWVAGIVALFGKVPSDVHNVNEYLLPPLLLNRCYALENAAKTYPVKLRTQVWSDPSPQLWSALMVTSLMSSPLFVGGP